MWCLFSTLVLAAPWQGHALNPAANRVRKNGALPAPEAFFGFAPGADKKLADYHQIIDYLKALDTASERLSLFNLGKTTEGNDFYVAMISAPENLARWRHFQNVQARLADPRNLGAQESEDLIRQGRAVVLINCALHSTEVGATQMAPLLAYELAASQVQRVQAILENVITLLVPSHNPDGQLMVVDWYRQHVDTPFEKAPLPWLYQKYTGHDINRDWFMFTQQETRLTVEKLYNAWRPHITIDMHQMGRNGARLFVPPYVDPYEPNVDPIIVSLLSMLGTKVQADLTAHGKSGVVCNAIFDAWTPARSYPHYHGGLRFLTETASADLASPVHLSENELRGGINYAPGTASWNFPQPWPGGDWSLRDIVQYDFDAALSVLTQASVAREFWIRSLFEVQRRAVAEDKKPALYVIPAQQSDPQGLLDLLLALKFGMVEIHRALDDLVNGQNAIHRGDYLVFLNQPYGGFAKALLERQVYPKIVGSDGTVRIPYDVTAHTLPLFLGVEVRAMEEPPALAVTLLHDLSAPVLCAGEAAPKCFALSRSNTASFRAVNVLLRHGLRVWSAEAGFLAGDSLWPAGTFILDGGKKTERVLAKLAQSEISHSAHGNPCAVVLCGLRQKPVVSLRELHAPRVGVYRSWMATSDEGWTRWVLEEYGFTPASPTNTDLQSERLRNSYDVIIFPDQNEQAIVNGYAADDMPAPYAGGIGESGVRRIREFVEQGGTLVALNGASEFGIKYFQLAIEDVALNLPRQQFSAPGAVLRVQADLAHPLAYGASRAAAVFFLESPVFRVRAGHAVLKYPDHGLLLSGWLEGESVLGSNAALAEASFGKGRVVLFGWRPQFRAQFRAGYKFLFNALFWAVAS